jgi:signal transduction histidine kinase
MNHGKDVLKMKKASSNQPCHNGRTNNGEGSLPGGEWLETDALEHGYSDEQPSGRHLLVEMYGKNPAGLRMPEKHPGLPGTSDALTQRQSPPARPADISLLWHELLSPLTLIKGYTATMLQLSEGITEDQRQQYLRGIDKASNRMVHLLEELRDVSRLEEDGRINAQRVSLRDLLRGVLSEMQNEALKHVIAFRPCAPLPRVSVDPEKIARVVTNLITNAIKYSPEGGDIEVEIKLCRTDLEFERIIGDARLATQLQFPCLVVSVADSGTGLPEAELERIFDKFYRVNNKLTRTVPGVGLGLYISKMLVEAHSGHLWARNRLTGGCVFSFSLPVG